jgi:hypothetical protein
VGAACFWLPGPPRLSHGQRWVRVLFLFTPQVLDGLKSDQPGTSHDGIGT